MGECDRHDAYTNDVYIHADTIERDGSGHIRKMLINDKWYVPETSLYSLEERATCNAWTIRRLKAENAKLHELAKEMYCVISENNSWWDFRCDETKAFRQQLQELGIEVDG